MANFALLIIVAAVALILLILRTNAAMVFLGLCAGSVLVQFTNKNMAYIQGHLNPRLLPHNLTVTSRGIELAILLLPAVILMILLKHSYGPSKWPIQVIPALGSGVLGALLVVPLLSVSAQDSLIGNKFWNLLEQNQVPLVAIGLAVCLAVIVLESHTKQKSKKGR